ncbi:MAG: STAS domain-containing protein [Succinivibrionaceae bacterium]|nr:STAS domain-containing protein [Succinivibrionaceae bacterium]
MEIVFENKEKYTLIDVTGRVDATTATQFDTQFNEHFSASGEPVNMLLDLGKVEYLSSAGLRCVLKIAKYCTSKGKKLVICQIQPAVFEVFRISGFNTLLTIVPSLEEAESKFD